MKYQIVISADSPEELASIAAKLSASTTINESLVPSVIVPLEENPFLKVPNVPTASIVAAPVSMAPVVTAPVLIETQPASTAVSPTPAGVELDPRGFPWDARIHSSSRARLAKGNFWRYARGISDELIAKVEDELRAEGFGNGPTTTPTQPQVDLSPAPASAPAVLAKPLPAAPILPAAPEGPTAQAITGRFTAYIGNPAFQGDKVKWVKDTLAFYGVADLPDLINHPHRLQEIADFLTSSGL